MDTEQREAIRQQLIAQANELHAHLPQYAGHWDDWEVAQVISDIQWHDHPGVDNRSASKGDYVLVEPWSGYSWSSGWRPFRTAFLPNSVVGSGIGCNTSVHASSIEVVTA